MEQGRDQSILFNSDLDALIGVNEKAKAQKKPNAE
jgi:hypothetical protein